MLDAEGIRVESDERAEKLSYRLREAQIQKVPYLLVLGNNEKNEKTISYRLHGAQKTTTVPCKDFVEKMVEAIKTKKLDLD